MPSMAHGAICLEVFDVSAGLRSDLTGTDWPEGDLVVGAAATSNRVRKWLWEFFVQQGRRGVLRSPKLRVDLALRGMVAVNSVW